MKKDRRSAYEEKRIRITVSFNEKEQDKMDRIFKKVLGSDDIKNILFNNTFIIKEQKSFPQLNELIKELNKIGNNVNQIARKVNSNAIINKVVFEDTVKDINDLKFNILKEVNELKK